MMMQTKDLDNPLVSIIITSYNRDSLIEKAIKSALKQDYPNLQIVISDNASTDGTYEIIKKYVHDPRIHLHVNDRNIGMVPNFLKATTELAKGKLITYVSSDDTLMHQSFISMAVKKFKEFPNLKIVHSINSSHIEESGETHFDYSYEFYKETFYKKNFVSGKEVFQNYPRCHSISFGGTVFFKDDLINLKLFSDSDVFSADVQLILKIIQNGDAAFLPIHGYEVLRHGENFTSSISEADTYIKNKNYIDDPYEYAQINKFLPQKDLGKWKSEMYVTYFSQITLHFLRYSKNEYLVLKKYLAEYYPLVHKRIFFGFKWNIQRLSIICSIFTKVLLRFFYQKH
jgi:glycosyltransferase involved in cell wall biosynthesis